MTSHSSGSGFQPSRADRWAPDPYAEEGGLLGRLTPEEGWLTVALVCLLAMIVGWSIADARWILGRDELTSFLIWIGLFGALWGFVSARLPLGRWTAQALGAAIGSLVIIVIVGTLVYGPGGDPLAWFNATANSVVQAYLDLTWRHRLTTVQFGHFCLILGILVWTTAQVAAYDVFGHRRPVNAVLLLAVVLIANMSMTFNDQFGGLVLFSGAALAVLIKTHAVEERSAWLRHRIWRASETRSPSLQGGFAFAAIAIVGSLVLTSVASSAPLAQAWTPVQDQLISVGQSISGFLPAGGKSRITPPSDFGDTAQVGLLWQSDSSVVFTAQDPDMNAYHWRVVAYDQFTGNAWTLSAAAKKTDDIAAGDSLVKNTAEPLAVPAGTRQTKVFKIAIQDRTLKQVVTPYQPLSVDVPVTRTTMDATGGSGGFLSGLRVSGNPTGYSVTAAVVSPDALGNGLTENKLRSTAGQPYPAAVKAAFLQGTQLVGPEARALLSTILSGLRDPTPYDVAKAVQSYLRDGSNFRYQTDITNINCGTMTVVDCFARYRVGFCMQYASEMTMLLRLDGIPARFVEGYLPGTINASAQQTVTRQQQHAWVEVYFPTYGWVEFDPTGGGVGQATVLPPGPRVSAGPSFSFPAQGSQDIKIKPRPGEAGGAGSTGSSNGGPGPTLLVVLGALLLVAIGATVLFARRRSLKLEAPEVVYRRIVSLASRLGYRPQPTQTVYEYVGSLGEVLPSARPQLSVVARATVETTYGRRQLGESRLRTLAEAGAQLRRALIGLVFRRRTWTRRRHRGT